MTDTPENADPPPPDAPADADKRQPRQRSRLTIALVAAALAVVLVALSLVGARMLGWWPSEGEPEAGPTSPPAPSEPPSPFAGTPAEDFAEGADGIVLPEAEPVGDFTAEEVAEALEQVRRALIAARLDHTMLIDHDPDEFLALLAPDQQAGVREEVESGDGSRRLATQLAEGASLASFMPRVAGEVSYQVATAGVRDSPVIEIVTRFVWVYPFDAMQPEMDTHLVVVRDEAVWEVALGRPWTESSQGLWLSDGASVAWGIDCAAYDEGVLQPAGRPAEEVAGDVGTIFDLARPLDDLGEC